MKKKSNKHQLEYQHVYLYTKIVSRLLCTEFNANISSPFSYKNGANLNICLYDDSITGVANNNYQRQQLMNNRNWLMMFEKEGIPKVVGKWDRVKKVATLYITERIIPDEIKVLNILNKYLTENNITVIIDTDEKSRYRYEIRLRRGDFIQHHSREH